MSLNAELGPKIQPREELVRIKRVGDRAALRYACKQTMWGVNSASIPAEYYEPDFKEGRLPATLDALRVLRPLGWIPVQDSGKVYLQPMYKPFTEEDAAARLQAKEFKKREEQKHREFSSESSRSMVHRMNSVQHSDPSRQPLVPPRVRQANKIARPSKKAKAHPTTPAPATSSPPWESRFV